jgi:hypothetical protein
MGRLCFPSAIQIVDFYHALEHAGKILVALLGSKEHPEYENRLSRWARLLLRAAWRNSSPRHDRSAKTSPAKSEAVEKELNYFVSNVERMRLRSG